MKRGLCVDFTRELFTQNSDRENNAEAVKCLQNVICVQGTSRDITFATLKKNYLTNTRRFAP